MSNQEYITKYRASVARLEKRRDLSLAKANIPNADVYNVCIATLNTKIAHLKMLDPKAAKPGGTANAARGELGIGKSDDAELCWRLDNMQHNVEEEAAKYPRFDPVVAGDAMLAVLRTELLKIQIKQSR
ncbi:hypothetical protein N0V90_012348 [Kalmusia sp. IMI 367209]|nr:hypothetical protein N0V90_012348 [Kalmusia sp. IMI 367209]